MVVGEHEPIRGGRVLRRWRGLLLLVVTEHVGAACSDAHLSRLYTTTATATASPSASNQPPQLIKFIYTLTRR